VPLLPDKNVPRDKNPENIPTPPLSKYLPHHPYFGIILTLSRKPKLAKKEKTTEDPSGEKHKSSKEDQIKKLKNFVHKCGVRKVW